LLVLLFEFGSLGEVAETVAVSTKFPFCVGFTTMVTMASAPFAIVPRLQTTSSSFGFGAQLPWVELDDPNPAFLGKLSVTVTPVAASPPPSCTVIVYVMT